MGGDGFEDPRGQVRRVLEDVDAVLHMRAHVLVIEFIELCGLGEQVGRHPSFADIEQQASKRQFAELLAVHTQVPAEAGRPHRTSQRVLVGVVVHALDRLQPDEGGGIAGDRIDHRLDAVLQFLQVELAAVVQVVHHFLDAQFQRRVGFFRLRQFGAETVADFPSRLLQVGDGVVPAVALQFRRLEFDEARFRGDPAGDVDIDEVTQAPDLGDVVFRVDRESFQRKGSPQPRPIKARDVHAGRKPGHADAKFMGKVFHCHP